MDNKTLLAIVLSVAVLIAYQFYAAQQQPQVAPPKPSAAKKEGPAMPATVPAVKEPAPIVPSSEEKVITVENDLYKAVFTSRGGTVKYWELKRYKDKQGRDIVLLSKQGILPALGIGSGAAFDLSAVNFSVSGNDLRLDENNKSGSIVFVYSKEGVSARRTYTFYAESYEVDVTDEVSGAPEYWITLGSDFGIFDKEASYAHVGPVLLRGSDLDELKPKKLVQPQTFKGDLKWIGQEDKYFCSALVPSTQVEEVKAWTDKNSPVIAFRGKPGVNKFKMYAGPKEHDRLAKLDNGLEYIIDYGFFSVIARPLFWILKFFYKFIGNYGWAIILLTIVVRIPFIPLVSKGQRSMKKLQQIQPKMNEIKEKYKKDPKRMQQEMMELYKKYKVNPMGGCLPMVLQIPVFFALYKVLLVSIELRNAPFMLWITDLSSKDPYYILPIVMGVTMVAQQKMTPSSMDPKQAKIMMFMPVVFTFMFLNFASGLVLYWLVNNLLSIIQQFYINKKVEKQPA
jgi:YidC/Oxa1 family membrane protein insertase